MSLLLHTVKKSLWF